MPIYEYRCDECGTEFEELVYSTSDTPECPGCHTFRVAKKLSTFGVGVAPEPGPCGAGVCPTPESPSCGAGACPSCVNE